MDRELQTQYEELRLRVIDALADRSLAKVARIVGLHENTVRAIVANRKKKPAIETIDKLADYLFGSGGNAVS